MNSVTVGVEFPSKEENKYTERRIELQRFLQEWLHFSLESIIPKEDLYYEYSGESDEPFCEQESFILQILYSKRLHKVVGEFGIRLTPDGHELFNTTNPDNTINNSKALIAQVVHAHDRKEILPVGVVNYPQENMESIEELLLH